MQIETIETRSLAGQWHPAPVPGERVFPEFNEAVHVLDTLPSFPNPDASNSVRYVSYHTGFTTPFVATWYHHDLENDVLYSVQEWRAYYRTTDEVAARVKAFTKTLWPADTVPVMFVANTSLSPFNAMLPGLIIRKPDIVYCIDTVRQRLIDKRLFLYSKQLLAISSDAVEPPATSNLDEWVSYKYCAPQDFDAPQDVSQRPLRVNDNGLQTLFQVLMAQREMQQRAESPKVLERRINNSFHSR